MAIIPMLLAVSTVFFSEATALTGRAARDKHLRVATLMLFSLVWPILIGVWFVGGAFLQVVLGGEYLQMAPTFAVLVSAFVPFVIIYLLGWQSLIPMQRARAVNYALFCGFAVLVVALCFSQGKFLAVAVAVLAAKSTAAFILLYFYRRYAGVFPWRSALAPLLAALPMTLFLGLTNKASIWLQIIGAGVIYGVGLLVLFRRHFGEVYSALFKRKVSP